MKDKIPLFNKFRKRKSRKEPQRRKIDKEYWREIWWSKEKAKEALMNLEFDGDNGKPARVQRVQLANGNQIPVEDVTAEQAHEFMRALCPSWAKP